MNRLDAHIADAVILLKSNEPEAGYIGAFSGGKDSIVIKELARMADVKVEWHYHNTTIDPPELIYFMREHHPDVIWDRPEHGNFFHRAVEKGFPTRVARWCCAEYKEGKCNGVSIMGIRIAESANRKKRWTRCVMPHFATGQQVVLPIRLWEDHDVWDFIKHAGIPYCKLYDEGFKRLGCVGCPLAISSRRARDHEWSRWPKMKAKWQKLFCDVWNRRTGTLQKNGKEWIGSTLFDSPSELFAWWDDGQGNITEWRANHGLKAKDASAYQMTFDGMEGEF